jgi:hypothetical protein
MARSAKLVGDLSVSWQREATRLASSTALNAKGGAVTPLTCSASERVTVVQEPEAGARNRIKEIIIWGVVAKMKWFRMR